MTTDWYILRSKLNKEEFLWRQLLAHELEVFYPCINVKPVNPRAKRTKPYFPGYIFVYANLNEENWPILQRIPGMRDIVSFGEEPACIPDVLIKTIQQQLMLINKNGENSNIRMGEEVVICTGPFLGYEAIFDGYLSGTERVRVLLKVLEDKRIPLELSSRQVEHKVKIYS